MPRPRNPTHIVETHEILDYDAIQDETWTLLKLIPQLQENLDCIKWMTRQRLVRNTSRCSRCNDLATFNRYVLSVY